MIASRADYPAAQPRVELAGATAEQAAEWDRLVDEHPAGTLCHRSGWGRLLRRLWRQSSFNLVARRGSSLSGVLPLSLVRSPLFGSMLVSSPVAIYGGTLAHDDASLLSLLAEAKRLARRLGVGYLELRDSRESRLLDGDPELQRKQLYVSFSRPIQDDPEALLRSFPKKIRYSVRRARAQGLSSELGREELLDDFYDAYASNVRLLGTPVYPKRLFTGLLREFPEATDIQVVRQGTRVAGATFNFYFRETVLPHYGCAYRALHDSGVSAFMYAELMRSAAARGFRRFDFGRSKVGSGSWAFKLGWKMAEQPLPYRFYLARARRLPELNPTNPKFRLLIEAWKRLPIVATRLLGPAIVRYIP